MGDDGHTPASSYEPMSDEKSAGKSSEESVEEPPGNPAAVMSGIGALVTPLGVLLYVGPYDFEYLKITSPELVGLGLATVGVLMFVGYGIRAFSIAARHRS
jgi:hypothetical protein